MKVSGKISVKGITLPVPKNIPVILDGIEIQYEAHFSVQEMIQALDVIDIIPDKLAGAFRKFTAYEKEFGDVVSMSKSDFERLTKENATQESTEENESDAQKEVSDVIKDMVKFEAEASAATEE